MYVFTQKGVGFNMNSVKDISVQQHGEEYELIAVTTINQRVLIGTYSSEDEAKAVFRKLRIALAHDDRVFNADEQD